VGVALLFAGAAWLDVAGLTAAVDPPDWPQLPLVGIVAIIVAVTPAFTAPPLPLTARPTRSAAPDRSPVEAPA
jgi:hypothetical protein